MAMLDQCWGAHATRVLAKPTRLRGLFCTMQMDDGSGFGGSPKPARESRALPGGNRYARIVNY